MAHTLLNGSKRTSIDFPQGDYEYMMEQVSSGKEKSMRDMLLKLVDYHRKYDMASWRPDDGLLQTHVVRWALLSDGDLRLFEEKLTGKELQEIGITVGKMWAEAWDARAETWDGDLTKLDNWNHVAETWKFAGWGKLDLNTRTNRIFVFDCIFSSNMVEGVLEGLLGRPVKSVEYIYPKNASTRIYAYDVEKIETRKEIQPTVA
jgi:hypothetical protein